MKTVNMHIIVLPQGFHKRHNSHPIFYLSCVLSIDSHTCMFTYKYKYYLLKGNRYKVMPEKFKDTSNSARSHLTSVHRLLFLVCRLTVRISPLRPDDALPQLFILLRI